MKKVLTICSCLICMAGAHAQYGDPHASLARTRVYSEREKQKLESGALMKDGIVYQVNNGQESRMYNSLALLDGSKVLPDGTIIKLDGTKLHLSEGQRINLDGQVSSLPKSEYVTMQGGKMVLVRDTIQIQMDHEMTMENGSKVSAMGYVITSEGKKVLFNEGDKMNLEGVWMNNQPTFNSKLLESAAKE